MPAHRSSNSDSGILMSSTSSVIAMANTPSLNASVRPVSHRSDTPSTFDVHSHLPATHREPRRERSRSTLALDDADRPRVGRDARSEEHTSELQSRQYLVCRL